MGKSIDKDKNKKSSLHCVVLFELL